MKLSKEQMITIDCTGCVAKLLHILVQKLAGKTIFPVKKRDSLQMK